MAERHTSIGTPPCPYQSCSYRATGDCCMNHIRLFSHLDSGAKRELMRCAHQSDYPKGSVIVHESDPIESIFIIRKGRIKTYRLSEDGEEYILDILHDGQALWHGMFLQDHTYHYSAACLTEVSVCSIRRTDFESFISAHPEVAMHLVETLSTELDDAEEKITILSIHSPKSRLARYLLHRNDRCLHQEIHLRLDEIAASVNLRPETVSRILSAFEKDGLVKRIGRGHLKVINRAALAQVSKE
ncbi:MAG: Crp/Fnr family transcriptional regulator [Coriobacteriaceae bacterium]|jgi:CRP-like cAMP-binding protein|nr:MAG: Crp/Fnr family transcriptional regulator [Coriobacteriaceae bacterium]